ncbi:hypothetical protein HD554DRAFT_2038319 [Boletus coccyginus]|nr:hypothetical protein HD554DRAFT_2038319 [Boletus coccyginus]
MSYILWMGGVGLHPDMLAVYDLFILLSEPSFGIPNQELVKDLEVVSTIGGHHMGEELVDNLAPNREVMQQSDAILLCSVLDKLLVQPRNVVARWDSHNPSIPLAVHLNPVIVVLEEERKEAEGVLLEVKHLDPTLYVLATAGVVILLLYRELIPGDLGNMKFFNGWGQILSLAMVRQFKYHKQHYGQQPPLKLQAAPQMPVAACQ